MCVNTACVCVCVSARALAPHARLRFSKSLHIVVKGHALFICERAYYTVIVIKHISWKNVFSSQMSLAVAKRAPCRNHQTENR